ncbi:MAG: PEP-CTERM sorting domain-containing protein [Verrucomicrobiota bacterium]
MKLNPKIIASAAVALLTVGQLQAGEVISINVGGMNNTDDVLGSAGVVNAGNWNNLTTVDNPSGSSLLNSSGAATTLSLSSTGWLRNTFNDPGDDRKDMYSNFLAHEGDPIGNATISLSSIPYATYDVYLYYNAFYMNNGGEIQTWTESQGGTTLYGLRGPTSGGQLTGYQQYQTSSYATASSDADAAVLGGNYLVFSGLTAANLTLTSSDPNQTGWKMEGLAGLQIVEASPVPEPSSLGLLGIAGSLLFAFRSRRQS